MNTRIIKAMMLAACLLFLLQLAPRLMQAQEAKTPYPTMAPLEGYLIADSFREMEIQTRTAPRHLARRARLRSSPPTVM